MVRNPSASEPSQSRAKWWQGKSTTDSLSPPMTSRLRSAPRQTGLQREVLRLYRSFLVCIRLKPAEARPSLHRYVASQFRDNGRKVQAKDITAIEFLLRKGRRSLEMLE